MRFKDWKYPEIEEGKLTEYNWLVQHKDKLKLGYTNAKNRVVRPRAEEDMQKEHTTIFIVERTKDY